MSQSEQASAGARNPAEEPTAPGRDAYDLTRFTLVDMVRCGAALRRLATESTSMEDAAQRVTRYLYENLRGKTADSNRSCVLVRFFKTHLYGRLIEELREAAI